LSDEFEDGVAHGWQSRLRRWPADSFSALLLRGGDAWNVGSDRDSDKRQRVAIEGFAKRAGFALVGEFSDPGVSGADPIEVRPGFSALLGSDGGGMVKLSDEPLAREREPIERVRRSRFPAVR
jgi:hypothetical protein